MPWGKGVNNIFKKGVFPSVHVGPYLHSAQAKKKYLKKLDKEDEGMSNMLFVGMTYIISLATAGCHVIWQSVLCHLGSLEVTVSYGNKGENNMREGALISGCWEGIFKPRDQQLKTGIAFSFIDFTMLYNVIKFGLI